MHYIIYETRNKVNNKIYVGYHSTENLNDEYLGSGIFLLRAIKKYGRENFERKTLFMFPTETEALLKEAEIVDYDFIMRDDTYNYKIGGEGGWSHIQRLIKEDKEFRAKMYSKISKSIKKAWKNGKIPGWKAYKGPNGMKGKNHSEETKKRISMNNGNNLTIEEIEKRKKDFLNKVGWGSIGHLAGDWHVSHTQVKRFLDTHIIGARMKRKYDTYSNGKYEPIIMEGTITAYKFNGKKEGEDILIISCKDDEGNNFNAYVPEDIVEIL